jgi:hypothetical protein
MILTFMYVTISSTRQIVSAYYHPHRELLRRLTIVALGLLAEPREESLAGWILVWEARSLVFVRSEDDYLSRYKTTSPSVMLSSVGVLEIVG